MHHPLSSNLRRIQEMDDLSEVTEAASSQAGLFIAGPALSTVDERASPIHPPPNAPSLPPSFSEWR